MKRYEFIVYAYGGKSYRFFVYDRDYSFAWIQAVMQAYNMCDDEFDRIEFVTLAEM